MPINKVVLPESISPGVIDEIDLAGVIRESTTGLGTEALDAGRAGLMSIDLWSARLVDRIPPAQGTSGLTRSSEVEPIDQRL